MKILNVLIPLVLMVAAAGCQSHSAQMSSSTKTEIQPVTQTTASSDNGASTAIPTSVNSGPQQIVTDKAIYTIEVIPNPRLSATSRDGDKMNEVYSSNIIAVYMHPRSGVALNSTNSHTAPASGTTSQPPGR